MSDLGRAALREHFRDARRNIDPESRADHDGAVRTRLAAVLAHREVGTVALSVPVDGEVDVAALAPELRAAGWHVVLPLVDATMSGAMEFHPWDDDAPLQRNRYGVGEPVRSTPVAIDSIDVIVVPAVAVDESGRRLGFGGGFYDRALAARSAGALIVAAVHDEQVAEQIPSEPHDVPADVVLTPTRTIWVDRAAR